MNRPDAMTPVPEAPNRGELDALRARILAAAARSPSPTRDALRVRAAIGYALALASIAGLFAWMGGLEHAAGRPRALTLAIGGGAALLAAVASGLVLSRGGRTLGRSARLLAGVIALVPLATLGWLLAWHGRYVEPFQRLGFRCLGLTLASATALIVVAFAVRARSVARGAAIQGAALAAAGGAWGGVVVDLWCPLTEPKHVAIGHVLPLIVVIGAGAVIGRLTLGVRARPTE
jgi:hypothetical protein